MLQALTKSANDSTREHAIDLLENRPIAWAGGLSAEQLAESGRLGGLIEDVMTGDLTRSWRHADSENQAALSPVIPEEYR